LKAVIPVTTERINIAGTATFQRGQEKKAQTARPKNKPLNQKK